MAGGARTRPWLPLALIGLVALLAVLGTDRAHAAERRIPTLAPSNTVIDGPSADILSLGGMAVARDGTGGLVYLKNVNGVPHVFVSRLLGGAFHAPQQVDAGLPGPSSQPVIAAANPGELLVAFINATGLYVVTAPNALTPMGGPNGLIAGASNPTISAAPWGKAYLAFTEQGAGGHDVRAAYYNQGLWSLESSALDAQTGDDAGNGTGRPSVTAAGDGVGNVAWGEGGHIFTRRIWGISPSINVYQADVSSLGGMGEISADQPDISSGGDSSYAAVVFHARFASGATVQQRVLMNRERAGRYDGIAQVDGQAPNGGQGADQGQVTATEYGRGFVTSETDLNHDIFAVPLSANITPTISERVNSQVITAPPDAVSAVAGAITTMIAWQQQPGSAGPAEIRLRYAPNGSDLLPEQVVSSPGLGPTDADQGLAAGGDLAGDAAVSWVQGSGSATAIVAAQLFQGPGSFAPVLPFRYANSANPILAWSPASQLWGAPLYTVRVDGIQVATTGATSIRSPVALTNGRHSWQVTAVNRAGLSRAAGGATVFVDTFKPRVSVRLTGSRVAGALLHIAVRANDSPAPLPRSQASGIKTIQVKWGDGAKPFLRLSRARASHVYKRRRTYTLTVIVKDRAANKTVVTRKLKLAAGRGTSTTGRKGKTKGKPGSRGGSGSVTGARFSAAAQSQGHGGKR